MKRLRQILDSLAAQFSVPLAGVLLSLAAVRFYSAEFWGVYMQHLLVVGLAGALVNMGSRDFLLRQYSREPRDLERQLAGSIKGKLIITAGVLVLLAWLPLGPLHRGVLLLWIPAQLSWQVFEALVQYRRLFRQAALIEILATVLLVAALAFLKPTLHAFLLLVVAGQLLKGVLYFWLNRAYLAFPSLANASGTAFLKAALPFLWLALAGAASSRGELYLMGLLGRAGELGQYQVLANFIHSSHLMASAILLPFVKNIYRLRAASLRRLERRFLLLGLALAPLITLSVYLILRYGYGFHFYLVDYLLAGGIILAFFAYVVRIQVCFRHNKASYVTGIVAIMGVANVGLSLWLIPAYGISGALAGALVGQVGEVAGFYGVKLKNTHQR